MRRIACLAGAFLICGLLVTAGRTAAADVETLVTTIQSVDRGGQGNGAAMAAWRELAQQDAAAMPQLLAALDEANPLAANWIRAAIETIGDRTLAANEALPLAELQQFLDDASHAPRARRLAFEWIVRADPAAEKALVASFLDDPSVELRRDAVAQLLEQADAIYDGDDRQAALPIYRQAFDASRDPDQVKRAMERLKELGTEVDVARHYGYVVDWHVIGPFDNTDEKGFAVAYPPESEVDLAGEYSGKSATVQWTEAATDADGKLDLHEAIEKLLGVTAYATVAFQSDKRQTVEIRFSTVNATKLWVNGELIAENEVYHTGDDFDQYRAVVTLEPGENRILLKICQNEMEPEWAHKWEFKLRVCDAVGTAVLSTDRVAAAPNASEAR